MFAPAEGGGKGNEARVVAATAAALVLVGDIRRRVNDEHNVGHRGRTLRRRLGADEFGRLQFELVIARVAFLLAHLPCNRTQVRLGFALFEIDGAADVVVDARLGVCSERTSEHNRQPHRDRHI